MCFMAAIRRPLRSKRARISPVRPRANASGFTRIRVRSKGVPPCQVVSGRGRGVRRMGGSSGLGRAAGWAAVGSSVVERWGGLGRVGASRSAVRGRDLAGGGGGGGGGRSALAAAAVDGRELRAALRRGRVVSAVAARATSVSQ